MTLESELPEPFTPPQCDLRGYPGMIVEIGRLFDSETYALSTGDEFKAAFTLYGKAFLQVPAASLPADDRILAHLSGAGAKWKKRKGIAIRGWTRCSDGRLYHRTVAEKALEAWLSRLGKQKTSGAGNAKKTGTQFDPTEIDHLIGVAQEYLGRLNPASSKAQKRKKPLPNNPPATALEEAVQHPTENPAGIPSGARRELKLSNVEVSKEDSEATPLPPEGSGGDVPASGMQSPPDPPLDAKTILFRWGLQTVMTMTGRPEKPVRTWIGLLLKALGDDAAALNKILQEAVEHRPIDPTAWISKAVKQRASQTGSPGKPEAFGHMPDTPGSIFVRRYRAGEIDADGNELKPARPAAGEFSGKTIEGEAA